MDLENRAITDQNPRVRRQFKTRTRVNAAVQRPSCAAAPVLDILKGKKLLRPGLPADGSSCNMKSEQMTAAGSNFGIRKPGRFYPPHQ